MCYAPSWCMSQTYCIFPAQLKFQTLGQPGVINGIKALPALGLSIMTLGKLVPKFEKAFQIKGILSKLWDKFWDRFGTNSRASVYGN